MLLSVIITTHSRVQSLARAIESVRRAEQYADIPVQIVVVSDIRDQNSESHLASVLKPNDISLCAPGLRGPAQSRNLGLQLANGKWITFLDDDDYFLESHFADLAPLLAAADGAVFCNYFRSNGNKLIDRVDLSQKSITDLYVMNFIPLNCIVFDRSYMSDLCFNDRLMTHEDWDFILSYLSKTGERLSHVDVDSVVVEFHPGEHRNSNVSGRFIPDYLYIYRSWPSDARRADRVQIISQMGLEGVPSGFI